MSAWSDLKGKFTHEQSIPKRKYCRSLSGRKNYLCTLAESKRQPNCQRLLSISLQTNRSPNPVNRILDWSGKSWNSLKKEIVSKTVNSPAAGRIGRNACRRLEGLKAAMRRCGFFSDSSQAVKPPDFSDVFWKLLYSDSRSFSNKVN